MTSLAQSNEQRALVNRFSSSTCFSTIANIVDKGQLVNSGKGKCGLCLTHRNNPQILRNSQADSTRRGLLVQGSWSRTGVSPGRHGILVDDDSAVYPSAAHMLEETQLEIRRDLNLSKCYSCRFTTLTPACAGHPRMMLRSPVVWDHRLATLNCIAPIWSALLALTGKRGPEFGSPHTDDLKAVLALLQAQQGLGFRNQGHHAKSFRV